MPASSLSRVCLASLAFAACAAAPLQSGVEAPWQLLARHGGSLRGVAVVERAVAWATGKDGAIWRTTDGGSSWRNVAPRGSEAWDFRDVEAFGADRALAMVAGTPARVLCTEDGGSSWRTVLADDRAGAFFDGMAFAGDVGVLFGDPLDGAFSVWTTRDAGATWQPTPFAALPAPLPGEAAFAAGGGCVAVSGVGDAATFWVATGGGARARLLRGDASGWRAIDLPLPAGGASRGAFAVAWRGAHGVVVGGDYAAPEVGGMATSDDGGATWTAQRGVAGFLSAATWLDDDTVFACGSHGVLTWRRGGEARYEPGQGFHACTPYGADGALAVGADGRIAVRSALVPLPLRLHGLWRDHMVVPTAATVPIVGVTAPHATVAVDASWGAQAAARADGAGRFRAALATPAAPGGPHTVRVFAGATAVVVADVLAGDVWLASGQSNMEMQLGKRGWSDGIDGHEAAIAAANLPQLRVFTVGKATADQPADEVAGEWQLASPATAADFSAVGYHFARALQQARGRPLGLVVSAWGGTVAEAWTPAAGLADFPEFAPQLQAQQRSAALAPAAARQKFWSAVAAAPGGPWRDVEAPEAWSRSDLAGFDGAVEYVRSIELPAAWQGQDLVVELGPLDDMDATAWDGERLGGLDRDGAWSTPRRYPVPATRTPGTRHELRVRVVDTNGEGGFGGGPELLLLRRQDDPTQALPLAGAWRRRTLAALADLPPWPRQLGPNRPAVLWNGMLAPFVGFPFAGAIWYQGESNRGRADQYERLFPALVRSWRAAFGPELAFLFVQIAPYGYDGDAGEAAELRQAQAAALTLPRTGMVVTLDCGDAKDIHPRNKQPVGERLALLARVRAYGEAVPCDGPVFAAAARRDETVRLAFRSDDGLVLGDGGGFEVAGADGVFHAAAARLDGDEVVLRAAAVPAPTAVRYAWAAVPAWSLRSRGGLPAAPFRAAVR